jgi:zinc/manganese transport system substrate-binding protein
MAVAAAGLTDCIQEAVPALDTDEVRETADAYLAELEELDAEVEATLATIPEENRVLITNHEVFGYFADRHGFEVAGAIFPRSTQAEADAEALAELAELLEAEGVPAVFVDTSAPDQLAEALAAEVGDVEVVALFSESLGPDGGETYLEMMTTNARRIADALT